MSAFGLGLMGAGSLLGSLGGFMGAQSAGRDARQARDWYDKRTSEGANRYGMGILGIDPWTNLTKSADFTGLSEADRQAAYKKYEDAIGGSLLSQFRGLEGMNRAGSAAIGAGYDSESARLRGLAGGNLGALQGIHAGGANGLLGAYDAGAAGIMNIANQYGAGREQTIQRDAARMNTSADRKSRAALAASGLGNSTLVGNQLGANARNAEEMKQAALQNLGDAQVGLKTGLASRLHSERSQMGKDLFSNWASTAERTMGQNLANEYARSQGKSVLDTEGLNRSLSLGQMTPNVIMSLLGSGVTNPWLGQNTSQYYPGYSAGGSALANMGSAMTAFGGQMYGYGSSNPGGGSGYANGSQMDLMRRNGGF